MKIIIYFGHRIISRKIEIFAHFKSFTIREENMCLYACNVKLLRSDIFFEPEMSLFHGKKQIVRGSSQARGLEPHSHYVSFL